MRTRFSLALTIPLGLLLAFSFRGVTLAADMTLDPPATPLTNLVAVLTGDQVVPGPGSPDTASGSAQVVIDTAAGSMCWTIWWDGIDEPISGAIRAGQPGEAGAPAVALADPLAGGCLDALDAATLAAIVADPSAYYLELATTAYPDGAIRGQLGEDTAVTFVTVWAVLTGANVLPAPGDPAADGWVQLDIDVSGGSLCVWWNATGLDDAISADLHSGAAGAVGDAVVGLPPPPSVVPVDPPPDGGDGSVPGAEPCQAGVDATVLQAIADDPSAYYVDVHTPAFPDGAARGQLSLDPPPAPPCSAPAVCDGALGAGDYEFYGLSQVLFFTLVDEWQAANAGAGFALADANGLVSFLAFSGFGAADACGTSTTEVGFTPGALADFLAAHPALSGVTSGSVTIGGLPALQLDAAVAIPDSCGTDDLLLLPAFGSGGVEPGSGGAGVELRAALTGDGFSVTSGEHLRLMLVELDGGTLVIALAAPAGEAFDSLVAHAQGVLDSIAWGPAPVPGDGSGGDPGAEAGGDDRGNGLPDTAMAPASPTLPLGALLLFAGLTGLGLARCRLAVRIG